MLTERPQLVVRQPQPATINTADLIGLAECERAGTAAAVGTQCELPIVYDVGSIRLSKRRFFMKMQVTRARACAQNLLEEAWRARRNCVHLCEAQNAVNRRIALKNASHFGRKADCRLREPKYRRTECWPIAEFNKFGRRIAVRL